MTSTINWPSESDAQASSRRAGNKRTAATAKRLVRISGEVLTLGDAAKRVGVSNTTLSTWYRRGVRTWEGLSHRGKPAA